MGNTTERVRLMHRPGGRIEVLFIAEAPPADPKRFFYFLKVAKYDCLYLAMMRALYDDARELQARELRDRKREYLARFRADGYYLIDAHTEPMPARAKPGAKKRLLRTSLDSLLARVRHLAKARTRIVLISSSVYSVCFEPLKAAGFSIANAEMIDFPCSGRQKEFHRKLPRALD